MNEPLTLSRFKGGDTPALIEETVGQRLHRRHADPPLARLGDDDVGDDWEIQVVEIVAPDQD